MPAWEQSWILLPATMWSLSMRETPRIAKPMSTWATLKASVSLKMMIPYQSPRAGDCWEEVKRTGLEMVPSASSVPSTRISTLPLFSPPSIESVTAMRSVAPGWKFTVTPGAMIMSPLTSVTDCAGKVRSTYQ